MSYLDGLAIGITTLAFTMIIVTGILIIQPVFSGIESSGAITNTMPTYGVFVADAQVIYSFDVLITMFYFGAFIISILAAGFLESDPVNLPLGIFMGVATIFISFIISNAAHAILAQPAFADVVGHIPNTLELFVNLPIYTALFILLYVAVTVARPLLRGGSNPTSTGF